ncbi:MAG: glycosyltransferase [Bacteroidales bacterium]|nr:glycosyltransferase [Bacteroidales bacterium]
MLKKTASVSIVAANFNNGAYLKDFINSVNESTVLPEELIVVDDGSTDDSLKILEGFSGLAYLKVIEFQENRGFCEALNAGIETATGDYIMRVDPDDIILKNRVETQVEFLEANKEIDVVGSNVIYFHTDTKKEVFRSNFPVDHSTIKLTFQKGEHGVQHPSTLIRARVMKKYKYVQGNFRAEDYDIFARMIKDGHRFANIAEPLTKMRIHGQSVSSNIQYSTIKRTFEIRDEIFGTSTSTLKSRFYYWYILNYRKFLISQNKFSKPMYLVLAGLCDPSKVIKRFSKTIWA